MNATPRFLVVARRVGERSSMAGVLHEVDSHRDALRAELRSTDSTIAREYEESPDSFETFEVYAVGRGNENSPRVFTPSEANRWWFSHAEHKRGGSQTMTDYNKIPDDQRKQEVKNYIEHGDPLRGYVYSVFTNDLAGSWAFAGPHRDTLDEWVMFLFDEAPYDCWGSVENVENWDGRVTNT